MVGLPYRLHRPAIGDLDDYAALHADAATWRHHPDGRHTDLEQSRSALLRDIEDWQRDSLGFWIVRAGDDGSVAPEGTFLGVCGCRSAREGLIWNLYYRFVPAFHGHGLAVRVGRESVHAAHATDPDRPVIASLLEHNTASRRTAERIGLALRWRGPDAEVHDGIRLLYADRPLPPATLDALTRT